MTAEWIALIPLAVVTVIAAVATVPFDDVLAPARRVRRHHRNRAFRDRWNREHPVVPRSRGLPVVELGQLTVRPQSSVGAGRLPQPSAPTGSTRRDWS